ncbi:MAG: sulfatase [Candidatus Hydrogenedentota bacterium]
MANNGMAWRLLAAALTWAVLHPIASAQERPNVVIILADDLGYCDTGLYDCQDIPTPNINSIAENGVLFPQGYVTAGTCSPSRAALMTGRYQQRYGFEFNAGPLQRSIKGEFGLPPSEITLADVLKKAGYATGIVGKWHLGLQERFGPNKRGFDEFFGFRFGGHKYFNPPDTFDPADRTPIERNGKAVAEPEYLTDAFTREAVSFIERNKEKPFFLYVPYNAPHTPHEVSDNYLERFPNIDDPARRRYVAMISALDDGVGRILRALEQTGLRERTLVAFLSDNGCALYANVCDNRPLRLGKTYLFEGGVRIPFAVQWPGKLPSGLRYDQPVVSMDLFPTIAAITGAEVPSDRTIDGTNLLPYLTGQKDEAPHETLFWRNGPNKAMRKGNLKLFFDQDFTALYELGDDVGETKNLAAERPEVVEQLKKLYAEWESQMVAPLWPSRPRDTEPKNDVDGHRIEVHI